LPVSRIFISHSSANNAEAIALRDWMRSQGWEDIFLDLDPERGFKCHDDVELPATSVLEHGVEPGPLVPALGTADAGVLID
jgi:hypothetical protein